MFAVDGLVNTSMPCARRIATSILVVVDLPLDPETTTRPCGKPDERALQVLRRDAVDDEAGNSRSAAGLAQPGGESGEPADEDRRRVAHRRPTRGSRGATASGDGWRSFAIVFDSIWRIRSRVTPNVSPIWSRVFGMPSPRPKRMRMTPASRSRQRVEERLELLLQHREAHRVGRDDRLGVLDEVAELAVAVFTEGRVQRDGLAAVLLHLDDLLGGHVELAAELFGRGLAAQVLQHLALHAGELVDDLDHVHRDADGAGLVGHGAGDRLADPPRRVGRELEALGVVELLDRTDEAQVALLDEVEELHAATGVALRERDHEAEVRAEQVALRALAVLRDPLQVAAELAATSRRRDMCDSFSSANRPASMRIASSTSSAAFSSGDLADLLQVVLDRVGGGAGDRRRVDRDLVLVVDRAQHERTGGVRVVGDGLRVRRRRCRMPRRRSRPRRPPRRLRPRPRRRPLRARRDRSRRRSVAPLALARGFAAALAVDVRGVFDAVVVAAFDAGARLVAGLAAAASADVADLLAAVRLAAAGFSTVAVSASLFAAVVALVAIR